MEQETKTEYSIWEKKFKVKKVGKIFDLVNEVKKFETVLQPYSKEDYLCAALSIITKNTRFEEDIKELVMLTNPTFYKE